MLVPDYPASPPYVYLDEVEIPEVTAMLDYLERGNRMEFPYLSEWRSNGRTSVMNAGP